MNRTYHTCNFLSSFLLYFYRNKFSLMRTPIWVETFENFLFSSIVIILIEGNKKNLTLSQNNDKWTKILWILGQHNSRHVIKHVTLKFNFKRVFLKTIFFETVTTITKIVFGESSWFLDWIFIEHASSVLDARFILFSFFALL